MRVQNPGALQNVADVWVLCAFAESDPTVLHKCSSPPKQQPIRKTNATFLSASLGKGLLARLLHDEEKARAAFFDNFQRKQQKVVQADPNFAPPICILGPFDAGLGREKETL